MTRPSRESWQMMTVLWARMRRQYGLALQRLDALAAMRPPSLAERALPAPLLLSAGDPETAHDSLIEVRGAAQALDDAEADHIRRYAQFWLAMIRRHPFDARRELREAAAVRCAPRLRRRLWLPPPGALDDPLDAEFDAWVKANPPGEGDFRNRRRGER